MYHALAGSNADLLIGPSETEGSPPEWNRVYAALEVWPESHWPGFALLQVDVLQSYTA